MTRWGRSVLNPVSNPAHAVTGPIARRLRASFSGRRGSAQLGLVLASAAVAGGMTLGSGVASHSAKSGYDLAWLADGKRGQVVQVDPVLGRANVRLQVANPGDTLTIQQGNGQLVVIDRKTGKISSIDLGTLLVGGSRASTPGQSVKVLLAGSRLYVADLARGTVQGVDPATEANIGQPWTAGRPLVDIGIDGQHSVWALDTANHLINLQWNAGRNTLAPVSTRSVSGAGAGSVIVGHDHGITLVGARGAIVRVGTSHDTNLAAPQVKGPLHGPGSSPDGLVPVAAPGTSTVVIVGPANAIVDNLSSLGCDRPASPTVFDGKIYVPCSGANKVLVLDKKGHQIGAAIPTPSGGDPELTISGGHLVIDVPGSGSATIIDGSGGQHHFPTVDPGIGVQNPSQPPPPPPPPPSPEPPSHNSHNGGGQHPNGSGGDVPDPGGSGRPHPGGPSHSGGSHHPNTPDSGTATADTRPDGSVLVSWTGSSSGGDTVVTRADTGQEVARVPSGATSAMVTVLDPGTTASFIVRSYTDAAKPREQWTASTNSVTTATPPGAVTGVKVTARKSGTSATLTVTWTAAPANGSAVSYSVSSPAGSASTTTTDTHATITVPCASQCTGSVSVTPSNSAGSGTQGQNTYTVTAAATPPPANPPPANPPPANPPPPPPPPVEHLPAPNQVLITYTSTAGNDGAGTPAEIHLTITPTADWQAFTGACTLSEDGSNAGTVPCGSGSTKTFEYYGAGTHTYVVTAHGTSQNVDSATATAIARYVLGCPYSFSNLGGAGLPERPYCPPCNEPNQHVSCQIPFREAQPDTIPADRPTPASTSKPRLPIWLVTTGIALQMIRRAA